MAYIFCKIKSDEHKNVMGNVLELLFDEKLLKFNEPKVEGFF